MALPRPSAKACVLCGTDTLCRMEVCREMRPICPDCIPILAAWSDTGTLARALLVGPAPRTVN
jgi:hypothetical protein